MHPAKRHGDIEHRDTGRRVAQVMFQAHATTWVLVNILMVVIWAATGFGYFWPFWVIVPWGVALGFHAWATFGLIGMPRDD
jgi:hypothetical protein